MNKLNGFLSLVFVAAFALVSCGDNGAADEQKRKDDSLAASVAKQKYDDSLANAAKVDTTKKVETPATEVKAKEQGGTKTTDTKTTVTDTKTTDANKGGNTDAKKTEVPTIKAGKKI